MKKYEELKIEVININQDIVRTSEEAEEPKDFVE